MPTRTRIAIVAGITLMLMASSVCADKPVVAEGWLAKVEEEAKEAAAGAARPTAADPAGEQWKKPIPLTFSIDYTLVTDYIWRGVNLSEYKRSWGFAGNEGRERLNHQLTLGTELDLGRAGRVGGSIWFEWFEGQDYLTPHDRDSELQEVDYTIYYGYNIESIGTDVEIGFIWYTFPHADADGAAGNGDIGSTQEIYFKLSFDDSLWWRALGFKNVKDPIVNPYLFYAWDMDLAPSGSYGEFGLSHDFVLADLGAKRTPVFKNITITPSWSMAWSHNWLSTYSLDPTALKAIQNEGRGYPSNVSRLNNMTYSLVISYDLKSALNIPDKYCGALYLNGFVSYSQAMARHFLNDELWGGISIGYEW